MVGGRVANCPNCGGQVEFKAGASLLAVCPFCSSAVARVGDDITDLEILGQVAPLADIASPLYVGLDGQYKKKSFRIVGRLQLDYGLGPWNEWYAAFDTGQWAWIAEAQGKVYITFGRDIENVPPFSHWRVGTAFNFGQNSMVVTERRKARFVSAEGDLPFAVKPGSEFRYCDLEGEDGLFGTLDFGTGTEAEMLFVGQELEYTDLFSKDVLKHVEPAEGIGVAMNCPNCGSGVEVQAPDSMTITCGACDAVLDCAKGNELYLMHAAKRKGPDPLIPLGTEGTYKGKKWTLWGHMVRSVVVYGVRYHWEEYLLRCADRSYAWLVNSEGHWTWVDSISAGAVRGSGRSAKFRGQKYKHFQRSSAKVDSLRGEFYWKVKVGDTASLEDFVAPPYVLSKETTAEEASWSHGAYVEPEEIQKIFAKGLRKKKLPKPRGVSLNQPNPYAAARKGVSRLAAVFSMALVLLAIGVAISSDAKIVYNKQISLPKPTVKNGRAQPLTKEQAEAVVVLSEPIEIEGGTNMEITVSSNVNNSWFFLQGALINEDSAEVRTFGVECSYYHGYTGGESWSEGDRKRTVYLGALSEGRYVLRLAPQWDINAMQGRYKGTIPSTYQVTVRSDVFLPSHFILFLVLLWLAPLFVFMRHRGFEKRRWAESDHAP